MINSSIERLISKYIISAYNCSCIAHHMRNITVRNDLYDAKHWYTRQAINLCNHYSTKIKYSVDIDDKGIITYFSFPLGKEGVQMSFHKGMADFYGKGHKEILYDGTCGAKSKRAIMRAYKIAPEAPKWLKAEIKIEDLDDLHKDAVIALINQL